MGSLGLHAAVAALAAVAFAGQVAMGGEPTAITVFVASGASTAASVSEAAAAIAAPPEEELPPPTAPLVEDDVPPPPTEALASPDFTPPPTEALAPPDVTPPPPPPPPKPKPAQATRRPQQSLPPRSPPTSTAPSSGSTSGNPDQAAASAAAPSTASSVAPGWNALIAAWLAAHKKYPEAARRRGERGDVTIRFAVAADGKVLDVSLVRGSGSAALDAAALAMLRGATVPAPGSDQTRDVRIRYNLTD